MRNSVAFDFGIVNCTEIYHGSEYELIKRFKETFDFVILTEFLNEGLIMLKKIFDLSYEDIVNLQLNKGIKKNLTEKEISAEKVFSKVSNADEILYNYYFKFYKNLSKSLKKEVTALKKKNDFYEQLCFDQQKEYKNSFNNYFLKFIMKKSLTNEQKKICSILIKY